MLLQPGDLFLDRYLLLGMVGSGGLGSVWKAIDTRLSDETVVAVKFLHQDSTLPATAAVRFRQEARILAKLSHPGIPKIYTIGDGRVGVEFFVFEYIEGYTLREVIRSGLALLQGLHFAVSLLEILEVIHEQGILHRDVKPENLLVNRSDSRLKMIDFGISKTLHDALLKTKTGIILGTLQYMPPEQMARGEYTVKSDLYSAGLVVYELLSGQPAFPASIDFPTMLKLKETGRIDPLRNERESVPPVAEMLIGRALAPDPETRPASAREFKDELVHLIEAVEERQSGGGRIQTEPLAVPDIQSLSPAGGPSSSSRTLVTHDLEDEAAQGHSWLCSHFGALRFFSFWTFPFLGRLAKSVVLVVAVVLVVQGIGATVLWNPHGLREENAHASIPSLPPRSAIVDSTSSSLSGAARYLVETLQRRRPFLDEAWLRWFAHSNRNRLERERRAINQALRKHFDELGISQPLAVFLARSKEYFSDARVPESDRWLTRSSLCDVELIELFCLANGLEFPVAGSVRGCAGGWDDPVDAQTPDLAKATALVFSDPAPLGSGLTDRFLSDSWEIPSAARSSRCLLWYAATHWSIGLVADVTIDRRFRRLIACGSTPKELPALTIRAHECWSRFGLQRQVPVVLLEARENQGGRAYFGAWVPRVKGARRIDLETRILDLELGPARKVEPRLADRILSFIPSRSGP